MRYSLLLNAPEPKAGDVPEEVIADFRAAYAKYAQDLDDAGVLISADILKPSSAATIVTLRTGSLQIQDGPFADTEEKLAGTFVIEVPDRAAALAWAKKCPGVHHGFVEIRPVAIVFKDGAWRHQT